MKNDIEFLKTATEEQLRDYEVKWPETIEEVNAIINAMTERVNDYGTGVYAISISALAAHYFVCQKINPSGFQASCADIDIIKRSRGLKSGLQILNYENILYPQYWDQQYFPSPEYLLEKNRDHFRALAKERLAKAGDHIDEGVKKHLERIAAE